MAGIILNGSVIKGLILNGSPVSAMLNGVKVFPAEEPGPTAVVLYSNTDAKTSGSFSTGSISTNYNYIAIKFNFKYITNSEVDNYMYWQTNGDHHTVFVGHAAGFGVRNLHKFFRSGSSSWNAFQNAVLGPAGLNSGNNYYINEDSSVAKPYKVVFDKTTSNFYAYIAGGLVFSGTYTALDPLNLTCNLQPGSGSSMEITGFTIYGCESLEDAQAL
jgi:hypothetical protein